MKILFNARIVDLGGRVCSTPGERSCTLPSPADARMVHPIWLAGGQNNASRFPKHYMVLPLALLMPLVLKENLENSLPIIMLI